MHSTFYGVKTTHTSVHLQQQFRTQRMHTLLEVVLFVFGALYLASAYEERENSRSMLRLERGSGGSCESAEGPTRVEASGQTCETIQYYLPT